MALSLSQEAFFGMNWLQSCSILTLNYLKRHMQNVLMENEYPHT